MLSATETNVAEVCPYKKICKTDIEVESIVLFRFPGERHSHCRVRGRVGPRIFTVINAALFFSLFLSPLGRHVDP